MSETDESIQQSLHGIDIVRSEIFDMSWPQHQ